MKWAWYTIHHIQRLGGAGVNSTLAQKLRVNDETYGEIAYRKLKEAIILGLIRPGDPLVERDLVEAMGVSRTPIRNAYQRLATEGLVDIAAHKGARVRSLSHAEAK